MAKSGYVDVQVTKYDTLRFNWVTEISSITDNTSNFGWELQLIAGSSGRIDSTSKKAVSVTIDGETWNSSVSVGIGNNETKTLARGGQLIYHNADGTKTVSFSFSQSFLGITWSGSNMGTFSGSGTVALEPIPRAATIISAPNFTDSDSPTITYSNPAGNAVIALQACISIVGGSGGDDIPYRDIPVNGTSYTFNLTTVEMGTLRNAVKTGNSIQVRFYVLTNLGGKLYPSYLTRTFSLNGANPVINSATAIDVSAQTKALTGNENYWIKGFSDISYNILATGQQGAVVESFSATCGNDTRATASGTFENVSSDSISVLVTDSRNNTAGRVIKPTKWIDYTGLTCTLANAQLDVDGTLNFTVRGVYFMGSFGAVSNDINLYYRFKNENDIEYSSWTILPLVASGGGYTASWHITGLDYRATYNLQIYAKDKLQTVYSEEYRLHKATPVFDWSENDFNFNVPVNIEGGLTVNGMPVVGGSDYVVEQGEVGYWFYRKWNSGLCEMWGWCTATYQQPHYMSTYQAFPVALTEWLSAIGTLNGFSGNLADYLTTNVKVECMNYGCNVWVQNSNSSFTEGTTTGVSLHIVGKWK
jgi:hypothetical protein